MMQDKKKAVAAILGPEDNNVGDKSGAEDDNVMHVLASELIEAVFAKDPKAVADALKAAYTECHSTGG